MNTNKEVEWRRFIVPKKVEQINDHLFIDAYKLFNPTPTVALTRTPTSTQNQTTNHNPDAK